MDEAARSTTIHPQITKQTLKTVSYLIAWHVFCVVVFKHSEKWCEARFTDRYCRWQSIRRHSLPEIPMRKATSRQTAVLPLGIKNRLRTELPALVALTAIGEAWFSPQHQCDLLVVALVVRQLAPAGSLQAHCAAELQRLCEQVISIENKLEIAVNLAECLPWLQVQPNGQIDRSLKLVAAQHLALAA